MSPIAADAVVLRTVVPIALLVGAGVLARATGVLRLVMLPLAARAVADFASLAGGAGRPCILRAAIGIAECAKCVHRPRRLNHAGRCGALLALEALLGGAI